MTCDRCWARFSVAQGGPGANLGALDLAQQTSGSSWMPHSRRRGFPWCRGGVSCCCCCCCVPPPPLCLEPPPSECLPLKRGQPLSSTPPLCLARPPPVPTLQERLTSSIAWHVCLPTPAPLQERSTSPVTSITLFQHENQMCSAIPINQSATQSINESISHNTTTK